MTHPETKTEWNEYLNARGAELLDISIGQGLNSTRVTMRCHSCAVVEADIRGANLVRRKHLCVACNGRESYTTEGIRQLINDSGGIYISGEVVNRDSLVWLNCPGCQREVEKRAHDIRRRPHSCHHCRLERGQQTTLLNNANLARAHRIAEERGGRCLTTDTMVSMSDPLSFECSLGHRWDSNLNCVDVQDTWCPQCASSRGERTVRALFEAAYGVDFPQIRPEFLKATGYHLDGYHEGLGLAFEYNGSQHYERNARFHRSDEDLHSQQDRDRTKAQLCEDNGVSLITVPYWIMNEGITSIREFLSAALATCGVPPKHDPLQVTIDLRKIYDAREDSAFQQFRDIVQDKEGHFAAADYLGRTIKLDVTCEDGHTWSARPYLIIRGHWCPVCAGNLPPGYDVIQKNLQEAEWSLDTDNEPYDNAHQTLRLRCPNGHLVTRTWNRWQQQRAAGSPSCEQCSRDARAQEFVDKMLERGFLMDVDLASYTGEGQPVSGICTHCAQEKSLPVQSWKSRSLSPCCSRPLPAYHPCYQHRAARHPA